MENETVDLSSAKEESEAKDSVPKFGPVKSWRNRRQGEKEKANLLKLLSSPVQLPAFQAFLKKNLCAENLDFWIAVEELKRIPSEAQNEIVNMVEEIYRMYMDTGSENEVCVSALEREELNKRRKEGNIDQTIYDRIQLSVFENMVKDSYLRFMNSNAWIEPLESARSEKKTPGPIKVARSDSSEVDPFMSLLQSEDGLPVFMEYCERQFCSENLQFWLAVERFKALNPQEESFNQLAEQVYNDFIKRNATIMEIGGISDVMRNRLSQQLAAPHRNMFDEVQSICYRTMKQDSYIKFIRSELWEQLEAKRLAPPAPWWRRSRGSGCCRTDTSHPTPGVKTQPKG